MTRHLDGLIKAVSFKGYSLISIAVAIIWFVIGCADGYGIYENRSAPVQHVTDINAIPAHLVIASVFIIVLAFIAWYRRRHGLSGIWSLLIAPYTSAALNELVHVLNIKGGMTVGRVMRVLLVLLLAVLLVQGYGFHRAGMQVTAGLDANFVINAWGGPTYVGAMAAHWLDGIILFYVHILLLYGLVRRTKLNGR